MSTVSPSEVQREARHHFELFHAIRNRIGDGESWDINGYTFDRVEPEEPTETGFADLVIYDGRDPWLVIECKKLVKNEAREEFDPYSAAVIKQASRYADDLGAEYIATYNGETLVLLRAHEAHRSLYQRRKVGYSLGDFEDEEEMIFTVLEDMAAIHEGDTQRWDEEFDVLVDRLRELHQFVYPRLQQSLENQLESDEEYASEFVEWANDQGVNYEKEWIGNDSLSSYKQRQRNEVHETFVKQDAYLLINQLLFYKIVEDSDRFEVFTTRRAYEAAESEDKILAIQQLSVNELDFLQEYLRERFDTIVEDVDYEAVFEQDEVFGAVEFGDQVADTVNDFIEELSEYNLDNIDGDFIGDLYEKLIPEVERRDLGEFYTPRRVAELIVKGTLESPDDVVLDPAVGTGTFLIEAYKWINEHDGKTHQEVVDQIAGVDVNRFAAHLYSRT